MTEPNLSRVILVDDEPDSLNLIHDILSLHGAEVHRADNGEACLALLDTVQPTLVVVDLAMPRPNGWDLLTAIRDRPAMAHVPVIAVTAFYSDTVAREALEAGFSRFLRKPIRANDLLETIRAL